VAGISAGASQASSANNIVQTNLSPAIRRDEHGSRHCWKQCPKQKWGPALLPAPTAPSEGYAGVRNLVKTRRPQPALDPGSPAQASLPTAAARESLAFSSFPSRRKFRLGPLMPRPKTKQLRCSTALLGMITSASRFASTVPKNGFSRVAQKEDHLFRRLFPAGHGSFPREFTTACRQRSVLEPLSLRLARRPSGETATAVPITR
jgi:hypothetical protein